MQDNKQIAAQIETYLSGHVEENSSLLALMFIERILVYRDVIDFEVAKFDYLQNLSEDLTYMEGDAM